jgi:hypothetical protein
MKVASTALGPDHGLVVDCGNFKAESVAFGRTGRLSFVT